MSEGAIPRFEEPQTPRRPQPRPQPPVVPSLSELSRSPLFKAKQPEPEQAISLEKLTSPRPSGPLPEQSREKLTSPRPTGPPPEQALVKRRPMVIRMDDSHMSSQSKQGKAELDQNSAAQQSQPPLSTSSLAPSWSSASSASTASTSTASPVFDLVSLGKQKIMVKQVLTFKDEKPVCLLQIGGQEYVLKAGKFGEMADHLTNTDLFNRADMPGVCAPQAMELTDGFRTALAQQLKSQNLKGLTNFDLAKSLTEALKTGGQAMISTFTPGSVVSSFLDYRTRNVMTELLGKMQATNDSASAVLALKEVLVDWQGLLSPTKKKTLAASLADLADKKNTEKRSQAISNLKLALPGAPCQLALDWMAKVNIRNPAFVAPDLKAALRQLVEQQKPLVDYAKTKECAGALAAIMTIDLIVGMDDRLVEAYGGTNFSFDPDTKLFWCIDNAKRHDTSLSTQTESSWTDWVKQRALMADDKTQEGPNMDKGKSFAEIFHWIAYDKVLVGRNDFAHSVQLSDQERLDTAAAVQDAVTATLKKLQALVDDNANGLPKAVRDRLRDRLVFVDSRNQLSSLLDFSDFSEIPTVKNPWFGKKVFRKVARTVVGTTKEQVDAETWKATARDPNTKIEVLTTQDDDICKYLDDHQDQSPDQRVLKALFATRAARLIKLLEQRIGVDVNSPEINISKVAAIAKQSRAWGAFDPSVVKSLTALAEQWSKTLMDNGDKDTAGQVVDAMKNFTKQLAQLQ